MITKKIPGRPRKGKHPYDHYLGFICSKLESERIREIAAKRGMSLSEFVRNVLNREIANEPEKEDM